MILWWIWIYTQIIHKLCTSVARQGPRRLHRSGNIFIELLYDMMNLNLHTNDTNTNTDTNTKRKTTLILRVLCKSPLIRVFFHRLDPVKTCHGMDVLLEYLNTTNKIIPGLLRASARRIASALVISIPPPTHVRRARGGRRGGRASAGRRSKILASQHARSQGTRKPALVRSS